MNFKRYLPALFIIILFATIACKKTVGVKPKNSVDSTTLVHTGSDVYAAGCILAVNGYAVACYWKNGVLTKLADSSYSSVAISIIVKGTDVYVTGLTKLAGFGNLVATYWKNGAAKQLSDFATPHLSESIMAVSGSDVYVAGYIPGNKSGGHTAAYWKNGLETTFNDNSVDGSANAIFVNGSDIYVAGYSAAPNYPATATYWKNGVSTKLTDSTMLAEANAIAIKGNDIYVAGYTQKLSQFVGYTGTNVATIWKNGVATILGDNKSYMEACAVVFSGSDVYVAGYRFGAGTVMMMYWKNGVATSIDVTHLTSYAPTNTAAIDVDGTDVYLSGGFTGYLKNGSFVQLPRANIVYGINVVPK